MIDPIVIGISVAGAALGTLGLRDHFARAAIKEACDNAAQDIAQFKSDNTYVAPLKEKFKAVANVLFETISQSREMRDNHIQAAKKLVIPNPNIPFDLEELQKTLMNNKKQFLKIMKVTYRHKVKNLFFDQVHFKVNLARDVSAKVAAATATGQSLSPEDIARMYAEAKEKLAPHLDAFQQRIVDVLDQTGAIDFTVETIGRVHDFVSDHISTVAAGHLESVSHIFTDLHHIPGAPVLAKTFFDEAKMVMDGEIDLDDAIGNAAMTTVIRAPLIKLGMILDGMTLGASLGGFTVLMSFTGKKITNEILEDEIRGLKEEFNKLKAEIENALHEALRTINKVAGDLQKELAQRIEACPDINDEVSLSGFMDELRQAFSVSLINSEEKLTQNTQEAIAKIPANTWVDKVLFIDRRNAVEKLYLEAQRDISSHQAGIVHNFSMAADEHAGDAIGFLLEHVMFDSPEIDTVLEKMAEVTETCAPAYADSLSTWQKETGEFHEQATEKINQVAKEEIDEFNAFSDSRKATMKSIRRRIAVNEKRQGRSPAPYAA